MARACGGRGTRSPAARASGSRAPSAAACRPGSAASVRPRRRADGGPRPRRAASSAPRQPGVGVEDEHVLGSRSPRCPRFQPAARPTFSCSISVTSGNRSRTNVDRPVGGAVVDDDRPDARDAREALLDPRQGVVGDDDAGDARRRQPCSSRGRAPPRNPSQSRIAAPGSASATVTRKKRKPGRERLVGGDADAAEEADEERLAHGEAVERERDQQDEEEERAHHVVDARPELDPDRLPRRPDRRAPERPGSRVVKTNTPISRRRGRGSGGRRRRTPAAGRSTRSLTRSGAACDEQRPGAAREEEER